MFKEARRVQPLNLYVLTDVMKPGLNMPFFTTSAFCKPSPIYTTFCRNVLLKYFRNSDFFVFKKEICVYGTTENFIRKYYFNKTEIYW